MDKTGSRSCQSASSTAKRPSVRGRARLIGFGADASSGQVRITRGDGYLLRDGSEETHARMQAKAAEFMRLVHERGLSMDNLSRREAREILAAIGMAEEETNAV